MARVLTIVLMLVGPVGGLRASETANGDPARAGDRAATRTGTVLYAEACATCHGPDGRGAPREHVGFDLPLPDFTDCSFSSREPDADWFAVVHEGGPVRAFEAMMPAFGEALTSEEIQRILDHIRGLCTSAAWPRGELNLPRALVTEKAYPEDEAVLTTVVDASGAGAVMNEIVYERRFGARNHVEVALPFGIREREAGAWTAGVGDIAAGVKRVLSHSLDRGSIVSVIGEMVLPTGNADEGFGKGATVVEPSLAVGQLLPADAFLQFQGGFEIVSSRSRMDHEAFWRGVAGRSFTQGRFGRTWSPMVELLGSRPLASGAKVHWEAVPQMQVTLNTRQHIMLNAGVGVPLGARDGRPVRMMVYLLWDWFDGGFFDGW